MLNGYYTTKEIADKLSIHPDSVGRVMRQRGVGGKKVMGMWIYPKTAVDPIVAIYKKGQKHG